MKWIVTLFTVMTFHCCAQVIDYWGHFPDTREQLVRLGWDNDFFAATDRYYSQGLMLFYRRAVRSQSFAGRLCFPVAGARRQFGVSVDHLAYTPVSIAFDTVLGHDHPFGATIRANVLFETIDPQKQRSLGWKVALGFIGPEAMGRQMQTAIHKALKNPRPKGWQNQLNTGLVLDLGFHAGQRIAGLNDWLILSAEETASLGTLHADLTAGLRIQCRLSTRNEVFSILFYANPAIRLVAYDGTLQGSLVSAPSVYTIPRSDISRVVLEREFGAEGRAGPFVLTGIFQLQSHQYFRGMTHRWGGIRIAWTF